MYVVITRSIVIHQLFLSEYMNKLHFSFQGYDAHLVSTFSEWMLVFSFLSFFLTYYGEFKYLTTSVHIECFGDQTRSTAIENPNSITTTVDC